MMQTKTILLSKPVNKLSFRSIPSIIGVYIFKYNAQYLYIGKSANIKVRILSHFENSQQIEKEKRIFEQTNSLTYIPVDTEFNALLLEANLIQKYHPKYNVIWKDNKSYLYIKITIKDEYPKLSAVRKENDGSSLYFGPFSSSKDVDFLLRLLRKVYPFCTQKKVTAKPCFYNKIGLCNPCPNTVNRIENIAEKIKQKKRYKKNIRAIINILHGNISAISKSMYSTLKKLVKNEKYEQAIQIRNTIYSFEFLTHFRSFSKEPYQESHPSSTRSLLSILKPYFPDLTKLRRLECYDISNLSQKQATGSMVVALDGVLDKSEYRKFKIKGSDLLSDFDMLKSVIQRRFKHNWPMPDLIILDGGVPQVKIVKAALDALQMNIPLIGIAKNPDRLIMGNNEYSSFKPDIYNIGFNLIRLLRDESHRFARKYHLYLRERKIV